MTNTIVSVENLSKAYQLGVINTGTFRGDLQRWWAQLRGLPDPHMKVDQKDGANGQGDILWALKDVNFHIQQGEALGIIGRNGAGKSTLLKILSRVTAPTQGVVKVKGRIASLLEVGTGFHPELTGRENIYMNGAILGMNRHEIQRKFDEIVDFSSVGQYIDTPVKRYSSGMYVRLAFAVAAHLDPEILIVDEVLAVGDAAFQKKCLGKMEEASKGGGRTVLFVSHNMTAIRSLCNKAILLEEGQIEDIGEVHRIVDKYLRNVALPLSEQVWEDAETAPGNSSIRLHRASVKPSGSKQKDLITVETPIDLEFEFWNYLPGATLHFSMHLFTAEGMQILADGSEALARKAGLMKANVQIPGDLLNDGTYRVGLMVVQDRSTPLYFHRDILAFEVHEVVRSNSWFGKKPGVIRPRFRWSTQELNEAEVSYG